jgi:hypothetical protein
MADKKKMYGVFTIVERSEKSIWVRVGTAFVNKDSSFNVMLDALPVNGRLHIREIVTSAEAKDEAPAEEAVA